MRKAILFVPIFFLVFSMYSSAQRSDGWKSFRHEVSGGFGANTLLWNIGESDKFLVRKVSQRISGNLSYRYYVLRKVAIRASFGHNYSRKNDKSENRDDRDILRVDYKTSTSELFLMAEYHFLNELGAAGGGAMKRSRLSRSGKNGLYVGAGIGMFYFRPKGEYNGRVVELRPIGEEGIDSISTARYDNWQLAIPVHLGYRYVIDENWRIGFEVGLRYSLNNYINKSSTINFNDDLADEEGYNGGFWNQPYLGVTHFEPDAIPINDLQSGGNSDGVRMYFSALLTLSYRFEID